MHQLWATPTRGSRACGDAARSGMIPHRAGWLRAAAKMAALLACGLRAAAKMAALLACGLRAAAKMAALLACGLRAAAKMAALLANIWCIRAGSAGLNKLTWNLIRYMVVQR